MITIINYGLGNLGSIVNMFKRIGVETLVTNDPLRISEADKILLPGVGAFDVAMSMIRDRGLMEVLNHKAMIERIPVLGVCLGMQLLTQGSEEGICSGLGWVNADTLRFPSTVGIKVPHMGWNVVNQFSPSPLTRNLVVDSRFYFVHSYFVRVQDEKISILKCQYGVQFDAGLQQDNIYGVQFHPEKSHRFGMQLLKNFATL